ncbi:hypothetical protein AB0383_16685 [Amycolatopsis sp. NPDC051373]|uniref:hypothetical protein n=1 Tax=Amycolatopsis sp. NPDC051373 TaxID=3155801 RepID=UPI0034503A30
MSAAEQVASGRRTFRDLGSWMVFDAQSRLYAIGDRLYDGVSVNNCDNAARKLLPPLIALARRTREPVRQERSYARSTFEVVVKPVLGGRDATPIAFLARYVYPGDPASPAPLVAAWEWEEPATGSDGSLQHWCGADAPALYGVTPPSPGWEGGRSGRDPYRFMNSILVEDHRIPTTAVMSDFRSSAVGTPLIRYMEQQHAASGERQVIRAVGQKESDRLYAGFSMRVDPSAARHAVEPPLLQQLSACAALIEDPLIIVDSVLGAVVMTSLDYPAEQSPIPDTSKLAELLTPEDVPAVLELVRDAAAHPASRLPVVAARVRTADGSVWPVRIHAVGISAGTTPTGQFVMCRLEPGGDQP